MDPILGIIGLVIGAIAGFFGNRVLAGKSNQARIEEVNKKADLTLEEARISSKRVLDEAQIKADKIIGKAEAKNESIKQKKISEAKNKFAKMKSDFESYKSEQKVAMKEREMTAISLEKELKQKTNLFKAEKEAIEDGRYFVSLYKKLSSIRKQKSKQSKLTWKNNSR
jgi:ribonuclease Y